MPLLSLVVCALVFILLGLNREGNIKIFLFFVILRRIFLFLHENTVSRFFSVEFKLAGLLDMLV